MWNLAGILEILSMIKAIKYRSTVKLQEKRTFY